MDGQTFKCPNCGMPLSEANIDFKTRIGNCEYCGSVVKLQRETINGSDVILNQLKNAVSFFVDKNYSLSYRYAESILSTATDNAVGLFVIGYYNAFIAETKTRVHLDKFFKETLPTIDFVDEEFEGFKTLVRSAASHLVDYEEYILEAILRFSSPRELGEFVEEICPVSITRRRNIDWMTPRVKDIYINITKTVDIPKTWYAMYNAIKSNPDSPFVTNAFYLRTKSMRFYNDYALAVGEIFGAIKTEALRNKFKGAYDKLMQVFKARLAAK